MKKRKIDKKFDNRLKGWRVAHEAAMKSSGYRAAGWRAPGSRNPRKA